MKPKRKSSSLHSNVIIGVDNAGEAIPNAHTSKLWFQALHDLGIQFVVYHYFPERHTHGTASSLSSAEDLCQTMEREGIDFALNLEIANWFESWIDDDGFDWVNHTDGTHRFNFKPQVLDVFSKSPAFLGLVYDEADHMLINRNRFITQQIDGDVPFLAETTGLELPNAYDITVQEASSMVEQYLKAGSRYIVAEHVWPALFHPFAKAGLTLAPKILKESWASVWVALAIGAAIEYDSELWITPDLWHLHSYPGHSPEELKSALMFAYWMGADRIYVENLNYRGSLMTVCGENIVFSPYGDMLKWFTNQYLPAHPRNYSFRDVKPDIGIIRFDDTDFGQAGSFWKDMLYGSKTLKSTPVTRDWLKIWHLLSHGVIHTEGLSWNNSLNSGSIYTRSKHSFFAPLNNVVAFDHLVTGKHLKTLKLVFLTGTTISNRTIDEVSSLVTQGLIALSPPHLLPDILKSQYTGQTTSVKQGSGEWIITENVLDAHIREKLSPFLGKANEIRYVFGRNEVTFEGSPDNDSIRVRIKEALC